MKSHKLLVLGHPHTIAVYQTLGIEAQEVLNGTTLQEKLESIVFSSPAQDQDSVEYGIVFVEEDIFAQLPDSFLRLLTKYPLPAVVAVPSLRNPDSDFSAKRLQKLVEQAIGSSAENLT